MDSVSNIVRIGQVSSVHPESSSVRVAFDDLDGMVSAPLKVLQQNTVNRQVSSLPEIGEHVTCLFLPSGQQEGFVLGSYFTSGNKPSVSAPGVYRTEFSDGTVFEYDLNTNTARIASQHTVEVDAKTVTLKAESLVLDAKDITIKADKSLSLGASAQDGTVSMSTGTPDGTISLRGPAGVSMSSLNDSFGV